MWREIYKPFYKQLFQGWRKRTGMKITFILAEQFIIFLVILLNAVCICNPVQIPGHGMEPARLKKNSAIRLCSGAVPMILN